MRRGSFYVSFVLALSLCSAGAALPETDKAMPAEPAPCPQTPNCVSSTSRDAARFIEPLHYEGSPSDARAALLKVIRSFPRSRVLQDSGACIRASFTSLVFRFVDDVEFCFDAASRQIHMRSASRVGYSDFGVNRRRLEAVRSRFREYAR